MNSRFFDNFFNGGGGESSSNRSLKKYFDLVKKMDNLFENNTEITTEDINEVIEYDDTESVTSAENAFYGCTNLTDVPNLNFDNVTNANYMFYDCDGLTNITLHIPNGGGKRIFYSCNNLKEAYVYMNRPDSSAFAGCNNLETLHCYANEINESAIASSYLIKGCDSITNLVFTNITSKLMVYNGDGWGKHLTEESLIGLVRELITYVKPSGSVQTTGSLTMGSTHLDKIKNKYVRLIEVTDEMREQDPRIDEKKPFEFCKNTDEGAMKLTAYASLKRWTLS
jgi:hypothetical protein